MSRHSAAPGPAWRIVGWLILYLTTAGLIVLLAAILYYLFLAIAWLA